MPRTLRSTTSVKNSLSLFVLGVLALIVVIGVFALNQSNGFSFFPHASTLSTGSLTTSSYMCQQPCESAGQCGSGQICAVRPNSGRTAQKFCYNPSCPDNQQCEGEGCGECRAIDSVNEAHSYFDEAQCMARCSKDYPGRICMASSNTGYGKRVCVPNVCRFDGMQLRSAYMRDNGNYASANYIRVHKNNKCPAHDYTLCEDGFRCEATDNGITITKLTDTINGYALGDIGINCLCQNNALYNDGSNQEVVGMQYCDERYTFDFENFKKTGESATCSFITKQCVRN